MIIQAPMPEEACQGQGRNKKSEEMALHHVLRRFKGLQTLELVTSPPYIQDQSMAFMLVSLNKSYLCG